MSISLWSNPGAFFYPAHESKLLSVNTGGGNVHIRAVLFVFL